MTAEMMTYIQLGSIILVFVVIYFFMYRSQKKRDKKTAEMRNSVEVGDEVITVGGIVGTVVSLREDTLLVETGSDRNKIRILRTAIQQNNTVHETTKEKK